jgi:hypothetical protein
MRPTVPMMQRPLLGAKGLADGIGRAPGAESVDVDPVVDLLDATGRDPHPLGQVALLVPGEGDVPAHERRMEPAVPLVLPVLPSEIDELPAVLPVEAVRHAGQ